MSSSNRWRAEGSPSSRLNSCQNPYTLATNGALRKRGASSFGNVASASGGVDRPGVRSYQGQRLTGHRESRARNKAARGAAFKGRGDYELETKDCLFAILVATTFSIPAEGSALVQGSLEPISVLRGEGAMKNILRNLVFGVGCALTAAEPRNDSSVNRMTVEGARLVQANGATAIRRS